MGDTTYDYVHGNRDSTVDVTQGLQQLQQTRADGPTNLDSLLKRAEGATDILRSAIKGNIESPGSHHPPWAEPVDSLPGQERGLMRGMVLKSLVYHPGSGRRRSSFGFGSVRSLTGRPSDGPGGSSTPRRARARMSEAFQVFLQPWLNNPGDTANYSSARHNAMAKMRPAIPVDHAGHSRSGACG